MPDRVRRGESKIAALVDPAPVDHATPAATPRRSPRRRRPCRTQARFSLGHLHLRVGPVGDGTRAAGAHLARRERDQLIDRGARNARRDAGDAECQERELRKLIERPFAAIRLT